MKHFKKLDGSIHAFDDDYEGELITADMRPISSAELAALRAPSAEAMTKQAEAALTQVVQQHLDATAQILGYDDIRSAATYAEEPAVAKFQNEGKALRAWRSLLWAAAYAKMQRVKTGLEPVPTAEVLIASLPAFTRP